MSKVQRNLIPQPRFVNISDRGGWAGLGSLDQRGGYGWSGGAAVYYKGSSSAREVSTKLDSSLTFTEGLTLYGAARITVRSETKWAIHIGIAPDTAYWANTAPDFPDGGFQPSARATHIASFNGNPSGNTPMTVDFQLTVPPTLRDGSWNSGPGGWWLDEYGSDLDGALADGAGVKLYVFTTGGMSGPNLSFSHMIVDTEPLDGYFDGQGRSSSDTGEHPEDELRTFEWAADPWRSTSTMTGPAPDAPQSDVTVEPALALYLEVGDTVDYTFTGATEPAGAPLTWSADRLPDGLTLSSAGNLSGTVTTNGWTVTNVTATAADGGAGSAPLEVRVAEGYVPPYVPLVIADPGLIKAREGVPYSRQLVTSGPVDVWQAEGFPPGLTLSASGLIAGTATGSGTYSGSVWAESGDDGLGGPAEVDTLDLHFDVWEADHVAVPDPPDPGEPDPDPEPVPDIPVDEWHEVWDPLGAALAPRVAAYVGRPDHAPTIATATAQLPVIAEYVRGYTRGRGWTGDRPAGPLVAVIVSAAARLVTNPEQVTSYTANDYSERPAVLAGWTLTELGVLRRYRKVSA